MTHGKQWIWIVMATVCVSTSLSAKSPCDEAKEKADAPRPSPQHTHLRIDAFEVRGSARTLLQIDAAMFENYSQAKRTVLEAADMLERLSELGDARPVARLDTRVNIRQKNMFQERFGIPPQLMAGSQAVHSSRLGWSVTAEGAWKETDLGTLADIDYRFEYSGVWPRQTEGDSRPRYYGYTWNVTQSVAHRDDEPVILVKFREDSVDGSDAIVTVLRLQADLLEAGGEPIAATVEKADMLLKVMICELTGDPESLDEIDPDELSQASGDASKLQDTLKKYGNLEILSRPSILVKEGQDANVTIGERVPTLDSVDDQGKPKINYEDIGISMDLQGRWIRAGERARLALDIKETSISPSSIDVGSGGTKLPVFTRRMTHSVIEIDQGGMGWTLGQIRSEANDRKEATRLIVGIGLQPVSQALSRANTQDSASDVEAVPTRSPARTRGERGLRRR